MGGSWQWHRQRGGVTEEGWAALAHRLTAEGRRSFASIPSKRRTRHPVPSVPPRLTDTPSSEGVHGTPWTARTGTLQDFQDTTSCLPGFARFLLWQEVTWHGQRPSGDDNDYILFCLFHINVSMKTLSVSGTVTFLFFQVRLFVFWFDGYLFEKIFLSTEKAYIQFKGKKNSNNVQLTSYVHLISLIFTCFCLETNT